MSLSRPAGFPVLKLPLLCIEEVVKSWDIFDIIFFVLTSKRARQIVKRLKIPLIGIKLHLLYKKWIELGMCKIWSFKNSLESLSDLYSTKHPLVLEKNMIPLNTSRKNDALNSYSYTYGSELIASKMAMEFLTDVFKCSIEQVYIEMRDIPRDIGVKSTVDLYINQSSFEPFGYAQSRKLNLLLEKLEVTGTCTFWVNLSFGLSSTKKGFNVDPKLFKCKKLEFHWGSAAWVTREILLQFEVPRLKFDYCQFSVEDIVSFVTNWFHSDNKKLEYLCIKSCGLIDPEDFEIDELNSVEFSGRTRLPSINKIELYPRIDFSEGLEIVRHDGLQATIHVGMTTFMFYIWHNQ